MKLDAYNRKIIEALHHRADISNVELADQVGLSPSACLQRTKALKEAGYFKSFISELDLDRVCENVVAYVEFSLRDNSAHSRRQFELALAKVPEFMDCLQVTGEFEYVCFSCASNLEELNRICNEFSSNTELAIAKVNIRVSMKRVKWFTGGYPLDRLAWKE